MVVQPNMPVAGIIEAWETTREVFESFRIDTETTKSLNEVASDDTLEKLVKAINEKIGSTTATCIEGG